MILLHGCFSETHDDRFADINSEKDKKIQELTMELRNKKRLCATYQDHLTAFMKIVEEHSEQLSKKVQNVARNLKEFESIELELQQHRRSP
uniref:Uncharacterized protein n=1 Tax=Manihot esculenta TaxID=3983 RepID=A0A2C9UHG7_MANES